MKYEVYTIYDLPSQRRKYKKEKRALQRVQELKSKGYCYGEVVILDLKTGKTEVF